MFRACANLLLDEAGGTAIEYALLAAAITAAIAATVIVIGEWLPGAFDPVVKAWP